MAVCIIGAGASGCICAYYLLKAGIEVTLFDKNSPLLTLLPTGGGRCNLAHAEYDFKELVKNYPRGEKFLYSVFSKFSTYDTIALFDEIGVEVYTQDDGRIFPVSNSSKDVRKKILEKIRSANFINECVKNVLEQNGGFKVITNHAEYFFDTVVIATGGMNKNKNFNGIKNKVTELKPSLVGLNCDIKNLSGVVLKNVLSKEHNICGDILFTHYGVSGPLIYKLSSLKAHDKYPCKLHFDLYPTDFDLQNLLNENSHKKLKNVLSSIFPNSFAEYCAGIYAENKAYAINGKIRDMILEKIHNFEITLTGTNIGEETVIAGGYILDEVDTKTLKSKLHNGLYIIGEALNIDGFCGGYNLQNAWSTAFVAAESIASSHQ